MSIHLEDTKDLLMQIDRYMKAGRIAFTLLTNSEYDKVLQNEIYIDYGKDPNGNPYGPHNYPRKPDGSIDLPHGELKLKGPDGKPMNIVDETARRLKEFIQNFLEVSVYRTKHYEPGMWLMLRQDHMGDTRYNASTIEQFYRFIQANKKDMTPYILQTFQNGKREVLIPYVTADCVFYDVSKIIQNEKIRDIDDVFELLYKLSKTVSDSILDNINTLQIDINRRMHLLEQEIKGNREALTGLEKNVMHLRSDLHSYQEILEKADTIIKGQYTMKSIPVKRGDVIVLETQQNKEAGNPMYYEAPMYLMAQQKGAKIYVEIGPGCHIALSDIPGVALDGIPKEFRSADIKIAQYGNQIGENLFAFVEQVNDGKFYIASNYTMEVEIWSKYWDHVSYHISENDTELHQVYTRINERNQSLNTLGLVPNRNTVIHKTQTTMISRGLQLSDDCLLIPGLSGFSILDNKTMDHVGWDTSMLQQQYTIPLTKLTLRADGIRFHPTSQSFVVPVNFWRPNISFVCIHYDNGGVEIDRYISDPIPVLDQQSSNLGKMRFRFQKKPEIHKGDSVGYYVQAPNYKESEIVQHIVVLEHEK